MSEEAVINALKPTYGWVIVIVAALAMVATLPGRTHGLGMVTERVLADNAFQLDRVSFSDMNLWGTLLGGLFCLPCGWLIDRFGLRVTLTVTVAILAAVVLWMTRISGNDFLFAAIVLTRGFGQSALSIISITMVGKWYRGRLGMPMAVYSLLLSLGFAGAMGWAKRYSHDDWRVLWSTIGWLLALGMTPLALLLTRDAPGSTDSPVDQAAAAEAEYSVAPRLEGFTLAQAMRTGAFWVFGAAISVVALIGSGISLFNESVLKQQGFSTDDYYDLSVLTFTVGLLMQLPVGWLARIIPLGRLQAPALLLKGTCLALLPLIHTRWGITAYAVGFAIAGTTTTVLFFTIWGQAYGRANLGQIQSVAQMMTVLASALGPKVLAECFERTGSYAPAFQVLAMALFALAACSWLVRIPKPSDANQRQLTSPSLPVTQEN